MKELLIMKMATLKLLLTTVSAVLAVVVAMLAIQVARANTVVSTLMVVVKVTVKRTVAEAMVVAPTPRPVLVVTRSLIPVCIITLVAFRASNLVNRTIWWVLLRVANHCLTSCMTNVGSFWLKTRMLVLVCNASVLTILLLAFFRLRE